MIRIPCQSKLFRQTTHTLHSFRFFAYSSCKREQFMQNRSIYRQFFFLNGTTTTTPNRRDKVKKKLFENEKEEEAKENSSDDKRKF